MTNNVPISSNVDGHTPMSASWRIELRRASLSGSRKLTILRFRPIQPRSDTVGNLAFTLTASNMTKFVIAC